MNCIKKRRFIFISDTGKNVFWDCFSYGEARRLADLLEDQTREILEIQYIKDMQMKGK